MGSGLRKFANETMFPAPPSSYSKGQFPTLKQIDGVPCLVSRAIHHRGYMLYLHSNSTDLGLLRPTMHTMARDTRHTVYAIEYPGYGIYYGEPSPEGAITAARRVYNHLLSIRKRGERIIVVGRSIGTGVATTLVAHNQNPPDALVLISPFVNMRAMAKRLFGDLAVPLVLGVFESKSLIEHIRVPTLIVGGQKDDFTPLDHSQALFDASGARRKYLRVLPNSTHTRLEWTLIYAAINEFTTDKHS